MASTQVVETSVTNNSPSQDSHHPDDLFQSSYVAPGFKPFSYLKNVISSPSRSLPSSVSQTQLSLLTTSTTRTCETQKQPQYLHIVQDV